MVTVRERDDYALTFKTISKEMVQIPTNKGRKEILESEHCADARGVKNNHPPPFPNGSLRVLHNFKKIKLGVGIFLAILFCAIPGSAPELLSACGLAVFCLHHWAL